MIYALAGLPGHGKSYTAVNKFILSAIKEKKKVFTNIPLSEGLSVAYPDAMLVNIDIDEMAKQVNCFDVLAPGAVIILDELWRIWPAGLKADEIPKNQMSFIKEHRHHIDELGREPTIVLVTQDLSDIAASIRNMVEVTLICSKMIDLGQDDKFRIDYYRGWVKGLKGPKDIFIKSEYETYKEQVFKFYKSHTKQDGIVESVDKKRIVNVNIFTGLSFKLGVAFLVLMLVLMAWGAGKTKEGLVEMQKKTIPKSNQPMKQAPPVIDIKPVSSPSPQRQKTLSERWRISGIYHIGFRRMVLVTDEKVSFRMDLEKSCVRSVELECDFRGEIVTRYTGNVQPFRIAGISPIANDNIKK
jgi:zona occludens toxin